MSVAFLLWAFVVGVASVVAILHGYRAGFVRRHIRSWALRREVVGDEARVFGVLFMVAGTLGLIGAAIAAFLLYF
jgi:hypothetical protein